ncbi:hypothetical protein ACFS07_14140 [Undibacterium arcticum]
MPSDSTGLGLQSIRDRLKLLHGAQAQLIITPNTPSGGLRDDRSALPIGQLSSQLGRQSSSQLIWVRIRQQVTASSR